MCERVRVMSVPSVLLLLCGAPLSGQLRPLEPLNWAAFTAAHGIQASARLGFLPDQRASLAGTSGDLLELGELQLSVRAGAVVLEFAGTPQRFFEDQQRFAAPTGGAIDDADGKRHDSGDYRVATAIRLTSLTSPAIAVLRFGTRLPTTDNLVGLDRDQIDFFALVGTRYLRRSLSVAFEAGLGIHGTRIAAYEQSDVLLYTISFALHRSSVKPFLTLLGQEDLKERTIRGNEDLGEARLGLRIGQRRWLEAALLRGYRAFSPGTGFLIGGGYAFDWR